jgi:ABC-type transporter Mla MlaB component
MAASAPQSIVFAIEGPITRTDLPGLCEEVSALIDRTGAHVALCDVSDAPPDAVTVEALALVRVAARRRGCEARLRGASSELVQLLEFIGLRSVLPD